jgi:glutathione S-transferase
MRWWVKHMDEQIHPACSLLTYAIGLRPFFQARPNEQVEALLSRVPDAARRATRRSALEHGIEAPGIPESLQAHVMLLERMEAELGEREWLVGEQYSLADAAVLPYLLRLEHLAMESLFSPHQRPRSAAWYQRMRARPAFASAVTGFLPDAAVAAMRRAGQAQWTAIEPLSRRVPTKSAHL